MNLEQGKIYRLTFPIGDASICRLENIQTYPGLPADYIFKRLSGDPILLENANGRLPLPERVLSMLSSIEEVESGLALFSQLQGDLKTRLIYKKEIKCHDAN